MNIVNKLTIRHLKKNKRRTLVTIIGVIISVAMVTAVATLTVSFLDQMKRQNITDSGEWHVQYKDVNKEQLKAIQEDEATEDVVITRELGYAQLEGSQKKPYLLINSYNTTGFKQRPIHLTSGRLPTAPNEVVISEEMGENGEVQYNIGDVLQIEVGERIADANNLPLANYDSLQRLDNGELSERIVNPTSKSFKIVGFIKQPEWESLWSPAAYSVIAYEDESTLTANEKVNAMVVLKKVKKSLYTHAEEVAKSNNIDKESVSFNRSLLSYYGVTKNEGLHNTLFSLTAIIIAVIIIGSVSLIYNAFAISVSERSRHLGMLASVGATKRQKRNSVFFEGFLIGIISIPLGIICGILGMGITFLFINSIIQGAFGVTEKLTVIVTPFTILVACLVSIITIFSSTYFPARKASKISAIDAIRQTADVKLKGKTVKTSKIVRKVFGFEAEIGLKNLKRNKRRYQATIFSLVISIVLFLIVSYFNTTLKKTVTMTEEAPNYDIQISLDPSETENNASLLKSITALDDVTAYNHTKNFEAKAFINEASLGEEIQQWVKEDRNLLEDGKYPYSISIHALDEQSLKTYIEEVNVNYAQLTDTDRLSAIVIDTVTYRDPEIEKYRETKSIDTKTGEHLNLIYDFGENERTLKPLEIAALTDKLPIGGVTITGSGLNIIISDKIANQLFGDEVVQFSESIFLKSSDPLKTQLEIEQMEVGNSDLWSDYKNRQREEQLLMLVSIFTYGFIFLISAISIANIFNTISTSITLRKREFAMLKSVGMTPKGFNKMINYESIFYGIKSLLYGIPISIIVMYAIHRSTSNGFYFEFRLPWASIFYCFVAVFVFVGAAVLYSSSKVKKENIIDGLKQENI